MRGWVLLLTAALLACDGSGEVANSPAVSERPAQSRDVSTAAAAPASLVGEWRVAGVDGQSIDLPHAITMSVDASRVLVVSDCVNLAWSYRYEGGRMIPERVAQESCARGLYPVEEALVGLFSAPANVRRTESNGIEIAGPQHSATIFSQ